MDSVVRKNEERLATLTQTLVKRTAALHVLAIAAEHTEMSAPSAFLRDAINRAYELVGPIVDCPLCKVEGVEFDHRWPLGEGA